MTATTTELGDLLALLHEEIKVLSRLNRLAHRQRRYMIRRDERRLVENAAAMGRDLPRAHRLARQREALLQELGGSGSGSPLKERLEHADNRTRDRIIAALRELARLGEQLQRRNAQNHQLASFSLDVIREEVRILTGDQGEGGAYGPDGVRAEAPLLGVVDGRA